MSKATVNAMLKEEGLGFIKMDTDASGYGSKCVTDNDGKKIKGIYLSSHSPMDVTSEASNRIARKIQSIETKLQHLKQVDGEYIVEETARTITTLRLVKERHVTYARSVGYDVGYQTSYLVPYYSKEKK